MGLELFGSIYGEFGTQSGFVGFIGLFRRQEWMSDYIGAKAAIGADKADYDLIFGLILPDLSLLFLLKWVWISRFFGDALCCGLAQVAAIAFGVQPFLIGTNPNLRIRYRYP